MYKAARAGAGRSPFRHLIYPLPEHGGLGVHLTLDLAGAAKFGPDVQWVGGEEYAVNPARADSFYPAIRTYFPGLPDGALAPAYSGAARCQGASSDALAAPLRVVCTGQPLQAAYLSLPLACGRQVCPCLQPEDQHQRPGRADAAVQLSTCLDH